MSVSVSGLSGVQSRKLKKDRDKRQSLLTDGGTKGSRTATTHRTALTFANVMRAVYIIICIVEFIAYSLAWIMYIKCPSGDLFQPISTLCGYLIMQIVVQGTLIIFCLVFFIEFTLYTDDEWISEVKKLREVSKLKVTFTEYVESPDEPVDENAKMPRRHHKRKKKKQGIIDDCHICGRLCSCNFCCRRVGAAFATMLTLRWSELHILCMFASIYYLLGFMLRLDYYLDTDSHASTTSTSNAAGIGYTDGLSISSTTAFNLSDVCMETTSQPEALLLAAISDALTAFGITLPAYAYSLCRRLKMIYERRNSVSDATVPGSTWERMRGVKAAFTGNSQMSIVQASKSIFNDKVIKVWMFFIFGLQFIMFVSAPILRPAPWSQSNLDETYGSDEPFALFVVHCLLLRVAVPLLLLNTVLSFTPKSSNTAQIMNYYWFHHILTPSSVTLIVVLTFCNFFMTKHDEPSNILISTYIALCSIFGIWQIWLFIRLLTLAEDAENDQEQFWAFAKKTNASLPNYFSKGVIYLTLWGISYAALLLSDDTSSKHGVDDVPSFIFAFTSLFMLIPLQKIVISPTYNDYFVRKNRVKYLVTFHITCLWSVIFAVQHFVSIAVEFYQMLADPAKMSAHSMYASAFSLSFAPIGYFVWLFGKYSGVLYPISMTKFSNALMNKRTSHEMHAMDEEEEEKRRERRKESKLSLTELYNHQKSLPRHYSINAPDEEENGEYPLQLKFEPDELDPADSLKVNRSQSESAYPRKSRVLSGAKQIKKERSKSKSKLKQQRRDELPPTEVKHIPQSVKTVSLNKMAGLRRVDTEDSSAAPTRWEDMAQVFGLRSQTINADDME